MSIVVMIFNTYTLHASYVYRSCAAIEVVFLFPEGSWACSLHWVCVILVLSPFSLTWAGVELGAPQRSFSTSPVLWFYDLFVSPVFCLVSFHMILWELMGRTNIKYLTRQKSEGLEITDIRQLIISNNNLMAIYIVIYLCIICNGYLHSYICMCHM